MTENSIEIPLSKKKIMLGIIGSLAFVAIGVWFLVSPPQTSNPFWSNPQMLGFLGVASILFFGLCFVVFLNKIRQTQVGLVLDKEGITDNSSGVSAGKIPWKDITHLEVLQIHRQRMILIYVQQPQAYIDRQSNALKRMLMNANYQSYGTPISISTTALAISFDELEDYLRKGLVEFSNKSSN